MAPPCCDEDEDSDEDSDEDQRTEDDDEDCCKDKEAHKHLPVDVVVRTKQQTKNTNGLPGLRVLQRCRGAYMMHRLRYSFT
jgi:hypothetical protein